MAPAPVWSAAETQAERSDGGGSSLHALGLQGSFEIGHDTCPVLPICLGARDDVVHSGSGLW